MDEFSETRSVKLEKSKTNGIFAHCIDKSEYDLSKGIQAKDVHAKWNTEDVIDSIRNIELKINQGQCFGICGSVGDGKV